MYCAHCGCELHYKDLNNDGWCAHCGNVVTVSRCKVPFWNLMAVFTLAWTFQITM